MKNFTILLVVLFSLFCISYSTNAQKKPIAPTQNIVGGTSTTIDQQPWQVYVTMTKNNQQKNCGGSIIGPTTILTAAHCVSDYTSSQVQVYAGFSDMGQLSSSQIRNATQLTVYPGYDGVNNDIALIEVNTPFTFNSNVQPIRFDGGISLESPGTGATISGWGSSCLTCSQSYQLQRANVTIVDITTLNNSDYNTTLNANQVAAGGNSTGTCLGDSGGPIWVTSSGQNYLIGISSLAPAAGCGSNASIFTRISSFCQWILQQVVNNSSINGPNLLCYNGTYSRLASNMSISWSSSNTSAVTINGNGEAIRQNNFIGPTTIISTGANNCGSASSTKNIYVGTPQVLNFSVNYQTYNPSYNSQICTGSNQTIQADVSPSTTSYNWSINSGNAYNAYLYGFGNQVSFSPYGSGYYNIALDLTNACGSSTNSLSFYAYNCFAKYTIYPNPTKDQLFVKFDKIEDVESLPDLIELIDERSAKQVLLVDIFIAFKNKSLKNDDTVEMNVKEFPRGTYYLRISNSRKKENSVESIRVILE